MPLLKCVRHCQSARVDVDLFYDVFGQESDPPLVLVAGLGAQMVSFHAVFCACLAAAGPFRVIRFDNRDVGFSTKVTHLGCPSPLSTLLPAWLAPDPPYTLRDMALDVVALLDALGIPRAHVLGMCLGASIAQWVGIVAPHRLLSLINLMGSSGPCEDDMPGMPLWIRWAFYTITPKSPSLEDVLDARVELLCRVNFPKGGPPTEAARQFVRDHSRVALERTTYGGGAGRQMAALFHSEPREALMRVDPEAHHERPAAGFACLPILILHGAADRMCPFADHAVRMQQLWPHAWLHAIRDMGHFIEPRMFDEIALCVRAFSRHASIMAV